ncbi:MAG: TonB-dependent receptor [Rhodothermia bacterium]|nr:TonB-dependent receptor [Rhodothermia bacterium]
MKPLRTIWACGMALLCLLAPTVAAQTISGIVRDGGSNLPLPGVTVAVVGSNTGTVTNVSGAYSLNVGKAGTFSIRYSFVGYAAETRSVLLAVGKNQTLDVSLSPVMLSGDEVVVTASRRPEKLTEAPASISVITAKDFDQIASFNVGELASKIQGVEFVRTGVTGVGFNARGFNNAFNAKVVAMTDGRNSMMAGGSGLPAGIMNTVIKEDIERLEVVLGPNSALYGPNAHNGVANTITKDPRRYPGTTVAFSGGSQSVLSARLRHAQSLGSKLAFKVTGEFTKGEDFDFTDSVFVGGSVYGRVRSVPERNLDHTFQHIRGEGHLYFTPKAGNDFILSYGGSVNDFLSVNNVGRNQIQDWKFSYAQARYVSPRLFGQVYYTWTDVGTSYGITPYTRDYTNRINSTITDPASPFFPSVGRLSSQAAETFGLRLGNQFKEKSGRLNAELQYNTAIEPLGINLVASASYQKDSPNTYGTSIADSTVPGQEGTLIEITQMGAALQLEKALPAGFKLVAAGRLDNHSSFGNQFAPKVAVVKTVGDGAFRASYGRAFSNPLILFQYAYIFNIVYGNGQGIRYIPNGANVNDASAIKTTDPLRPEQIGTYEVGYKGTFNKKVFVDVAGYYGKTKDFLSPTIGVLGRALTMGDIEIKNTAVPGAVNASGVLSGAQFLTYFNYGQVDAWGVDLGVNYYLNKSATLGVKYSWFDSDITDGDIKNDANRDGAVSAEERSLNAPNHRVAGTLSLANIAGKPLFANISARWVQEYDFYSGNQIGTAAGEGKRGVVSVTLPSGVTANYLKNWNHGALGGFTTVDLSMGYALNKMFSLGAAVSNVFNVEQREFVGSPSIGRLISFELKANLR